MKLLAVIVGAALGLGHDVVDLGAHVHDAVGLSRLADAGVPPHHALTGLHPLRAVAALVPAAAPLVSKAVGHHLVRDTAGAAVVDKGGTRGAGFGCGLGHE